MNILAVDDEPLALSVIETFAKQVSVIEDITLMTSAVEALEFLQNNDVDLVYLDINMPYLTGVEFAKLIPDSTMVIFTTAYEEYALTGFDLSAVDYIVKPFSFDRFLKATMKANELLTLRNSESGVVGNYSSEYLMIKVEYSVVKVLVNDILYVEGLKDYVKLYTTSKNYVTKSTMKNVEQRLSAEKFMRVHKSYIINLGNVSVFENNCIDLGGTKIPLGSGYRERFFDFLEKHKL
ncbi:MAG: LytTR family DNA-binding domain-containing protein [Rikenellaceae bacterium]